MASASCDQSLDTDDRLLECAICMDKFVDPCVLPCSHTFCRQCIIRHHECAGRSVGAQGEDENVVSCPACRQTWPLPADLCVDQPPLSTDVAMNKLELDCGMTTASTVQCDSCGSQSVRSEEHKETQEVATSTVFEKPGLQWCINCSQNLCSNCVVFHGHKSHCVVPVALQGDEFCSSPCPIHEYCTSDLFCWRCRQLVCTKCATSPEHQDHSCDDVVSSAARLRSLLLSDATSVDEWRHQYDQLKTDVDADKHNWLSSIQAADDEVKAAADELRALVDRQCALLSDQLMSTKQLRLKQLQSRLEDVEQERSQLDSLWDNIYSMVDHAVDTQLLVNAGNLHERVERCLAELTPGTSQGLFSSHPTVVFIPSDCRMLGLDYGDNLLGRVDVVGGEVGRTTEVGSRQTSRTRVKESSSVISDDTRRQRQTPPLNYRQLLATLSDSQLPVCGLAVVADCLYVCYTQSADLDVYDAARTTYRRQRSICVPGLTEPSDMTGTCGGTLGAPRLFVSSETERQVFRVTLMASSTCDVAHRRWATDDRPYSVSMMQSKHLLVVLSRQAASVSVLDDDGRQLRRLRLPASVTSPWSAVHVLTSASQALVVCHGDLTHERRTVSLLDWSTGAVKRRYEWVQQPATDRDRCLSVMHMVVESDAPDSECGGFLVVDECCDSVQRVDSSLTSHESLLQSSSAVIADDDSVVQQPRQLCLDSARERLYVGLNDGRVKVFANGCVVM